EPKAGISLSTLPVNLKCGDDERRMTRRESSSRCAGSANETTPHVPHRIYFVEEVHDSAARVRSAPDIQSGVHRSFEFRLHGPEVVVDSPRSTPPGGAAHGS